MGRRSWGAGLRLPADASISFLQFSCAMIVSPAGKAASPLTWSPSLCVMMTVSTVFGVILAISAITPFSESTVVLVSTRMTPVLPMMNPSLEPTPPCTQ